MNKKVISGIEMPMPKTIRGAIDDPAVRGSVTELGKRLAQEALDEMSKESKDSVPNERQKKALKAIADAEAGRAPIVNSQDAEECCDKGWAIALNNGGYRLTEQGRKLISN